MGILDHMSSLFTFTKPEVDNRLTKYDTSTYSPNNTIPRSTLNASRFMSMIYTRLAMDVASCSFQHIRIDETGNKTKIVNSDLARIFEVEANLDQSSTDFFHDLAYSLFDEGIVAVVPVKTRASFNIDMASTFDIEELRVGKVIEWYPTKVKVRIYNDITGQFSEILAHKRNVAIIENPMSDVMSKSNPTYNRLLDRLSALDKKSSEALNSRLNMILQLPYPIRGDKRNDIAEKRIEDIQNQLKSSEFGIAYTGSEERITQISTTAQTNQSLEEVKYLTNELLSLVGVSANVFNGTASTMEMEHYFGRTIEPITKRIQEEFQRKFITKTAYSQGQRVFVYMDPFRLLGVSEIASVMDALLRNSILTPNEARSKIGFGPSDNPMADELYNRNIADSNQSASLPGQELSDGSTEPTEGYVEEGVENQNEDNLDQQLVDAILSLSDRIDQIESNINNKGEQ